MMLDQSIGPQLWRGLLVVYLAALRATTHSTMEFGETGIG
jgi:hypothetical protein